MRRRQRLSAELKGFKELKEESRFSKLGFSIWHMTPNNN